MQMRYLRRNRAHDGVVRAVQTFDRWSVIGRVLLDVESQSEHVFTVAQSCTHSRVVVAGKLLGAVPVAEVLPVFVGGTMFEQLFEGFRKASESSILAQQEMLKQAVQQWPTASIGAASSAIEQNSSFQKRLIQSAVETWERNRQLVDSTTRATLQFIEQSARISDAKSPDDYRRMLEELWRKMFEVLKGQSEAQFAELKKASQNFLDVAQGPLKTSA
jgi:hypothetical protein